MAVTSVHGAVIELELQHRADKLYRIHGQNVQKGWLSYLMPTSFRRASEVDVLIDLDHLSWAMESENRNNVRVLESSASGEAAPYYLKTLGKGPYGRRSYIVVPIQLSVTTYKTAEGVHHSSHYEEVKCKLYIHLKKHIPNIEPAGARIDSCNPSFSLPNNYFSAENWPEIIESLPSRNSNL